MFEGLLQPMHLLVIFGIAKHSARNQDGPNRNQNQQQRLPPIGAE